MSNVLLVTCNSDTTSATLRRAGGDAIATMKRANSQDFVVRERHLAARPLPTIGADVAAALRVRPSRRSATQWKAVALADMMLQEAELADVLLITAPLAEGNLPGELSAWIAHVAEAAMLAPDERSKHCALHDTKVALVVVERADRAANPCPDLAPLRDRLLASLAPLGVRDVMIFEADADGYPLRHAPVLLIVSRVAHA